MSRLFLVLLFGLLACADDTVISSATCDLELLELSIEASPPGASVTLRARPLTTAFDTALLLDNTRAAIVDLTREGCESCDSCREEAVCTTCGDCDSCDAACKAECIEQVQFIVPEMDSGEATLRLINQHGQSDGLPFTISPPADTGSAMDTGPPDTAR
jgi:hypothetical protein